MPLVLGGQPWEPGTVLDRSPAAARLGVRPGQPLGSAQKFVPEATFLAADGTAYRAAFEAALDALAAFTPSLEGEADPEAPAFGRALLGIEGLERLWGDETVLAGRAAAAVAAILPGAPRAGIGNTRFGAAVAAGLARPPAVMIVPPGGADEEAAFLAPLPVGLLPAPELQSRLALFGLRRMGELAALPRSAVVARFGTLGGELHDLVRGLDGRPLVPRRPVERLRADAELDPPVEQLESLRFVLHHLAGALCAQLAARGAGAARAILELELEGRAALHIEQVLPEPVAVAELVERLLVARLETTALAAPVIRIALELDGTAPQAGTQLGLFTPQSAGADRLAWQLAGLAIRFGADRIWRVALRDPEAPLPEERVAWMTAATDGAGDAAPGRPRGRAGRGTR